MPPDNQNAHTTMQGSEEGISNEEMKRTIDAVESRHANAAPGTLDGQKAPVAGIAYKYLKQRHPDYDSQYWRRLRALYAGGKKLLADKQLLREIFPPHRDEHTTVYNERLKRAFYTPYAGEIVDHIVSALCSQPVTMTTEAEVGSTNEPDEWWAEFYKDVSPMGGEKMSIRELLKESMLTAQQCQRSWVLIDLPNVLNDDGTPTMFADRKAQEEAGALDAYVVPIEPESVVDWEEDETGSLEWVLIHVVDNKRDTLLSSREYITERWTYYDRAGWAQYELRREKGKTPKDTQVVPLVNEGAHTFGEVPLCRLELPDGLWTMAKLEGLAREHLNKRNGLAWGELQSLLPELYEFQGPEESWGTPVSAAQQDATRATRQAHGQGFVQQRGHQDKAEFIGPDTAPFTEARNSCNSLRDEMHRVTHQMALSVDNSAAALGRSADSKAQDQAATAVVLTELGKLVRAFAEEIYRIVSVARGEEFADEWQAQGMEEFDDVGINEEVERALIIDQLELESPTFRRRHRFGLMKLILGDDATADDLEQIEAELDMNIPDEWETESPAPPIPTVKFGEPEDEGPEGEGDATGTLRVEQPAGPKRMIATGSMKQ